MGMLEVCITNASLPILSICLFLNLGANRTSSTDRTGIHAQVDVYSDHAHRYHAAERGAQ